MRPKSHPFVIMVILLACMSALACDAAGQHFYLDSKTGNDANDGLGPQTAWKTLPKASGRIYAEGDQLLLRKGCSFAGSLIFHATGTGQAPVVVDAYDADGASASPVIDARGFLAGVQIVGSAYVEVRNLELTANAGVATDEAADKKRYGVLITGNGAPNPGHVSLLGLHIHDIFATTPTPLKGRNPKGSDGIGIESSAENNLLIQDCVIEKTGFVGIFIHESDGVSILNNTLRSIGGPGMKPSRCQHVVVRGNLVDGTGSSIDPRMDGRGSGIWPWNSTDVLIERNAFMHARGKQDSCGAHIDFGNTNVVIQDNLSVDNAGGFMEILGNNHNCAYRYNISVNDGFRKKGDDGAVVAGRTLWVSGYDGDEKPTGPVDTYIYNNTVFVKPDIHAKFDVENTARGLLVANNIFVLEGNAKRIEKKAKGKKKPRGDFQDVLFMNNLSSESLPEGLWTENTGEKIADPQFKNPGGFNPADYIPGNAAVVKGTGAVIGALPGDSIGLAIGLKPETDFFGNKIPDGAPDLGAIVFGGQLTKAPALGAGSR